MKTIQICKAWPVIADSPEHAIEDVSIVFDKEVDTNMYRDDWDAAQREVYEKEAVRLEEALYAVLPGGTYNRLLARLLERSAGLLRIPLGGR